MTRSHTDLISSHFSDSVAAMAEAASNEDFIEACRSVATACGDSLLRGGKLLLAGNGGSAGDAQHIAGEFVSRLNFDRAPLAAIALTVDTSVLTAIGNDYGYEQVFERQVRCLANSGDVFIGITTSGRSKNVLNALRVARERGAIVVAFCGAHIDDVASLCDLVLAVPSTSTPLIQQIHITAAHAICGQVEATVFNKAAPKNG